MDSPDEIHLGSLRSLRQIFHHILRHSAIFNVRLRQSLGVRFFPLCRVIQVRLRPIHIGVHLQAHHKAHQRLFHRQIVGITIITFHQSATLLVGIVEERHRWQLLRATFQNLFQRRQPIERSIRVFTQNHHFCLSSFVVEKDKVSVVFAVALQYISLERQRLRIAVGHSIAACHPPIESGMSWSWCIGKDHFQFRFLENLLRTRFCSSIHSGITHHRHRGCETDNPLSTLFLLWLGIDVIDSCPN